MLEQFGFSYSRETGWTHADYPNCIVGFRMDQFVVNSPDGNKYACAMFIRKNIRKLIKSICVDEITLLKAVGYLPMKEFFQCLSMDAIAELQIIMETKSGPPIAAEIYSWQLCQIQWSVGGKCGGYAATFEDIWQFLPPIYSIYLSQRTKCAEMTAECKQQQEEIKRLRRVLDEVYAPGGIGAKAAEEHFKRIQ